jgi:SAM-dependent methyltransferase
MDFRGLSDQQWLEALSGELNVFPDIPKLPPEQIQLNYTGASGKRTMIHAFEFYLLVKRKIAETKYLINDATTIMDFGCGWGRITRFWLKDFEKNNIYGVDPLPEMIQMCKETLPGKFLLIDPTPQMPMQNNFLDIVTAYSVFSHLNEDYSNRWFKEFHRILKPGGLLVITTRSRSFIEYCASLNNALQNQHTKGLSSCFKDPDRSLQKYDAGDFVHQATGGGGLLKPDFFGESCIPKKYFLNFNHDFILNEFVDQLHYEPTQACAIMVNR